MLAGLQLIIQRPYQISHSTNNCDDSLMAHFSDVTPETPLEVIEQDSSHVTPETPLEVTEQGMLNFAVTL